MPFADDVIIEQLAASQRGLVTRDQLLAAGISRHVIDARVRANRLRVPHRGVYRVGPVEAPHGREVAALLACGPQAVLSHRSAAWLWQLVADPGDATPVELALPGIDRGRRPGIRLHRVSLEPDDVANLNGIPLTTPARTIVDLSAVLASRELESVVAHAERQNLIERRELLAQVTTRPGRPGAPLLRALLAGEAGPSLTRSEAEERLLNLIRKAQLPSPETNVRIGNYEVDFFWRRVRLVVEVDGFAFHSTARTFENDRRRDASLAARGIRVMRVTWKQLTGEPEATLVRLTQALIQTGNER